MTPAKLHALLEVDNYLHDQAERGAGAGPTKPTPSANPKGDLEWLAGMGT